LGLDHCDKNKESVVGGYDNMNPPTMNSIIMPGAGKLHQDDIAGIVSLYGANAVEHTPNPADGATEGSAFQEEGNLTVVLAFPGGKNTKWDFGDGTTAIGARVTHTFTVAGTYTIQVEGAKGKSGHVTVVVEPLGQEENNNTKAKPSKVRVRPTK
jgi:hypothetical protein